METKSVSKHVRRDLEIERIVGTRGRGSQGLFSVKKIPDTHGPSWNWIFISLCVIGIALDPFFLYIPVINDDKKCLGLDKKLGIVVVVLRSFLDFFHVFYIIFQLHRHRPFASYSRSAYQRGDLCDYPQESARKYLMLFFPIDLLSILPLPQVMIIIMMIQGSKISTAIQLFRKFVICQYAPRIIRTYPLFTKARRNSHILAEATWVKAVINLFLYMLASHVIGALWFCFAVERKTACWKSACINYPGCVPSSFYCGDGSGDSKFLNDFCSTKSQNATMYDFGIFDDALRNGIMEVTNFPQKFLNSFRWGLQNLSCFGQNLQPSSSVWENLFAIAITIYGLVLFLFLIGNMQIYLQSKTLRSEDMRLKAREIEQWMPFRKLSVNLQQQVKKYQRYVWRETKGVDVQNLLNNLPKDIRRNIMCELCLDLLKRVPIFEKMDQQLVDAMCDHLKPVLYTGESYIVRESEPVDEMLFVMRGKLLSMTDSGIIPGFLQTCSLKDGDYLGEELIAWALNPHSSYLPISRRTVRALTEVEAFALMADDLKSVVSQFRRFNRNQLQHIFRFYSIHWRIWAALFIQAAWRRYTKKKKLEESRCAEENSLRDALAKSSGISTNLRVTIYATRFAANVLGAIRRNGKSRMSEGRLATLLQKPAEPEFPDEEP